MNVRKEHQEDIAPLAERLRDLIKRVGPISFRDWMEAALYDEREGYYCRQDLVRWGRTGDYRTSAETSPLFAATFARYFAALYQELGAPHAWTILEAGAGAGHFARGILETLQRNHARVFSATRYLVDEASGDARERAQAVLAPFNDRVEFRRLAEIESPLGEGVVFANELLDAFPVHRVTMRGGRLLELCVDVSETGAFGWVQREPTTPQLEIYIERAQLSLSEGQIVEVNLEVEQWIKHVASILHHGFIIIIDYGATADELYGAPHRRAGTLRAFRGHRLEADVLARPGEQDLTTTIDWTQVRRAGEAAGLQTVLFERQDQFLLRAGLLNQLERLTSQAQSEAEVSSLRLGAREMILPGGMSQSFQVLVQKCSQKPEFKS